MYISASIFSLAATLIVAVVGQDDNRALVWSDEFDGSSVNEDNWKFEEGDGCPDVCGWGNNELESYQKNNVYVRDGNLVIEARKEQVGGREYTSGRMTTQGKQGWTYGRFEVRAKLPTGQGIWPAIWMLPKENGQWPKEGEIDIMELIGSKPNEIMTTIHFGNEANEHQQITSTFTGDSFTTDFHSYSVVWVEDKITWYVDGAEVFHVDKDQVTSQNYIWPFDKDFSFVLNVAVGGNLPGNPDDSTTFPQSMEIDYARVYQ